jgi:hypothetical protein
MKMSSNPPGIAILDSEVTNIGSAGFWLLADDKEYFVPFADYPVFQTATIEQIFFVRRMGTGQFHWPALDADIKLDALDNPDQFPLRWR